MATASTVISTAVVVPDFEALRPVALGVRERLRGYAGVFDISDNFEDGKEEIKLRLKPAAELLGLTLDDLARIVELCGSSDVLPGWDPLAALQAGEAPASVSWPPPRLPGLVRVRRVLADEMTALRAVPPNPSMMMTE